MDKTIRGVHINGPDIELLIKCPECGRSIFIGEDDGFCPLCYKEIESANIKAWEEYATTI